MMLILAALLLGFTGFCLFGLPYLVVGPQFMDSFRTRWDQKLMLGLFVTAAISLFCVALGAFGLISAPSTVQVMASSMTGLPALV